MNEKALEKLVRAAVEVDELERTALAFQPAERADAAIIRLNRRRLRRVIWQIGASIAAAAALVLGWLPRALPTQAPAVPGAPAIQIAYWPGIAAADGERIDCFESSASERCAVLAVFHRWRPDGQHLEWQLYEWEDGRPLAELSPDEVRDITLDVTDAPPMEQLLVVAIAKNRHDLPTDEREALELLNCLHDVTPPSCTQTGGLRCASAVQACLPDDVRVVPQAFCVE